MTFRQDLLAVTALAGLLALPTYALAQQGGSSSGSSSMQTTTTQTTPQQGPVSGTPAARAGAEPGGTPGSRPTQTSQAGGSGARDASGGVLAQGNNASGGVLAQGGTGSSPDGTPGNPPSTATQRAADGVTGGSTPADGTPGNPPGTAAGRAMDRTLGTNTTGANPAADARTGATATGATAVDSAALRNGRRATKIVGSNVYNENNESIGEVDDIIIPQGGTGAPVAVISVGGFLGIGAKLVAVPYERLQMNQERNRWTLPGATKDSLTSLPTFSYDAAEPAQRRG